MYLSIYLFVYLYVCLTISLLSCPSVCLSAHPSLRLLVSFFTHYPRIERVACWPHSNYQTKIHPIALMHWANVLQAGLQFQHVHTNKQNIFTYVLMVSPPTQNHFWLHTLWLFLLSHKHYIVYQASTFPLISQCSERFRLKLFHGYVERKCYMLFYPQSIPENRGRYNISEKDKQMQ